MDHETAARVFTEKLRDFCRAHRTGRRVDPAMARIALDWELELSAKLQPAPLAMVAEEQQPVQEAPDGRA